jgi:hypothetical protein
MRRGVRAHLAHHTFKAIADFFEARRQHFKRVVWYDAEHYGTHGLVSGFILRAWLGGKNRGGAVADDVFHVGVWEDASKNQDSAECGVGEVDDDGQDEDDVAVGEEEMGEALQEGAEDEPC